MSLIHTPGLWEGATVSALFAVQISYRVFQFGGSPGGLASVIHSSFLIKINIVNLYVDKVLGATLMAITEACQNLLFQALDEVLSCV